MPKKIALYTLSCLLFYSLCLAAIYHLLNDNLPDLDELESFQHKRITKVFSSDGRHLKNFLEENREILTYAEIPQAMKDALISIEDRRFFSHWGIDIRRIFGAAFANLRSLDLTAQGASTLTQQLARNLFAEKVGRKRSSATLEDLMASYSRKIREQITAVHIERLYTKQEILTMYLNTVLFGHGRYGLKAAARYYFDKEVGELSVEECALLAGLLRAPSTYSPLNNPQRAWKRRNQVLDAMVSTGRLSRSTCSTLQRQPIRIHPGRRAETYDLAPYFIEYVRLQLKKRYGAALTRDGFTIYTTLDSRLQRIAEKHFDAEIGKVQSQVNRYLARHATGDYPDSAVVQAAFVAMDPRNGHILAMIGGRDFRENKFNRATQALRPPGSAFKPFVYTAAIDNGRFPIDVLEDNAITIHEHDGTIWDPENYDRQFKGPMTLREAFKQSRNLIAIKLAQEIGPGRIARYAHTMGISTPIDAVTSIGIGTSAVHLLEMVAAYCVFPNKGIYVEPVSVEKILDKEGSIIFEASETGREVLRPAVAVVMTDMMRSVIDEAHGTGHSIRFRYHFKTAAAGKTGTTNNYADAWFIGFTPHLVAGVWVGMDDPSLRLWPRQAGAVAALPLWARFMEEVYRTVEPYRSKAGEEFDYPADLVEKRPVCQDTHKLATRYCPRQSEEIFIKGDPLPESCPLHGGSHSPRGHVQRF